MTTIESYTQYDKFAQWLKQGRPRRDGLPVIPTATLTQTTAQPNKPRPKSTPSSQRPLQANRGASPNGQRARDFIAAATMRPTSREVADKFHINQQHASALIKRHWGPVTKAQELHGAVREYLQTVQTRPMLKDLVQRFHIAQATAQQLVNERFGPKVAK